MCWSVKIPFGQLQGVRTAQELGRAADDYQGEKVFEDRHIPVRLGGKAPRGGAAATRLRRRGSQGERPGPNPEGCLEEK